VIGGFSLNATGNWSATEEHYHRAIAVTRQQGAKLFQLQADQHAQLGQFPITLQSSPLSIIPSVSLTDGRRDIAIGDGDDIVIDARQPCRTGWLMSGQRIVADAIILVACRVPLGLLSLE
jgi:hypothetical protein